MASLGRAVVALLLVVCAWLAMCSKTAGQGVIVHPSKSCNAVEFRKGDHLGHSITFVLQDLLRRTPSTESFDLRNRSPRTPRVFGRASCSTKITSEDCKNCLIAAIESIKQCHRAIGAQVNMGHLCFVRYEKHRF